MHLPRTRQLALLLVLTPALASCPRQAPAPPLEEQVEAAAAGDATAMEALESQVEELAQETADKAESGDPKAAVMAVMMKGDLDALLPLAEAGNALAMFEWGKLQLDPVDPEAVVKGWQWIKQAADAGLPDAAFMAGKNAYNGLAGFTVDTEQGRRWLEAAAEAGHGEAAFTLGTYSRYGLGTDTDLAAAKTWYELALANGFKAAADELESL